MSVEVAEPGDARTRWLGPSLDSALAALLSDLFFLGGAAVAFIQVRAGDVHSIAFVLAALAGGMMTRAAGLYALGDAPRAYLLDGWGQQRSADVRRLIRVGLARQHLALGALILMAALVSLAL